MSLTSLFFNFFLLPFFPPHLAKGFPFRESAKAVDGSVHATCTVSSLQDGIHLSVSCPAIKILDEALGVHRFLFGTDVKEARCSDSVWCRMECLLCVSAVWERFAAEVRLEVRYQADGHVSLAVLHGRFIVQLWLFQFEAQCYFESSCRFQCCLTASRTSRYCSRTECWNC